MPLASRARAWTLELVARPSVTNSPGERDFGPWLGAKLLEHPYFAAHPEQVRVLPTGHDLFERSSVFALVRGSGRRTVVLTGHYDVVSVQNYGALAPHAFSPEALLEPLIAELEGSTSPSDQQALRDLKSGDWLPGRATLDMKSGLAAGLALLEAFAGTPEHERVGNLLFLTVPDEEEASHGMRSAVGQLADLALEWDLELLGAINLDAEVDPADGESGQAVFLGSVGKVLPTVMLIGRPTHAGAPYDGVSAALMLSELLRRVEVDPDLLPQAQGSAIERSTAEPETPPVLLQLDDLKPHYDITTPEMLWCSFNVLMRSSSPGEVLEAFVNVTHTALASALHLTRERVARYALYGGAVPLALEDTPQVLTYAELYARALERGGEAARQRLEALSSSLSDRSELDLPRICQQLTLAAVREAGLVGPAAVVGLGSWYYPTARLEDGPATRVLMGAIDGAVLETAAEGVQVRLRPYFSGVSDMSFLGGCATPEDIGTVRHNTPAWGVRLKHDYSASAHHCLSTVNIGPWGRDYHQRTERVYAPYAFEVLPRLLERVTTRWLAGTTEGQATRQAPSVSVR